MRVLRLVAPSLVRTRRTTLVVAAGVALAVACDHGAGAPCAVDRDCGSGLVCLDEICGSPSAPPQAADAGVPETAAPCTNDGVSCGQASECCSGACTQSICGVAPGGGPACKLQLETCLSSDECCPPLTCSRGLCR